MRKIYILVSFVAQLSAETKRVNNKMVTQSYRLNVGHPVQCESLT